MQRETESKKVSKMQRSNNDEGLRDTCDEEGMSPYVLNGINGSTYKRLSKMPVVSQGCAERGRELAIASIQV
jgi:hypothetical protein